MENVGEFYKKSYNFNLIGTTFSDIQVESIDLDVSARLPAPSQTAYFKIPQGLSDRSDMAFVVDQESDSFPAREIEAGDRIKEARATEKKIISLRKGDTIGVSAIVYAAEDQDIRFTFRIRFSNGKTLTVAPTDGNKDFRIVTPPRTLGEPMYRPVSQNLQTHEESTSVTGQIPAAEV